MQRAIRRLVYCFGGSREWGRCGKEAFRGKFSKISKFRSLFTRNAVSTSPMKAWSRNLAHSPTSCEQDPGRNVQNGSM